MAKMKDEIERHAEDEWQDVEAGPVMLGETGKSIEGMVLRWETVISKEGVKQTLPVIAVGGIGRLVYAGKDAIAKLRALPLGTVVRVTRTKDTIAIEGRSPMVVYRVQVKGALPAPQPDDKGVPF